VVRKEPSRARTLLRQPVGDSISLVAAKDGMPVLECKKTGTRLALAAAPGHSGFDW